MTLMSTCTDNVSRLLSFYADGSLAVQIKSETVLSSSFYLEKQFEYWNFVEFPRPQLLASDMGWIGRKICPGKKSCLLETSGALFN